MPQINQEQQSERQVSNKKDIETILKEIKCFLFDCDGVLWRGQTPVEGVPEAVDLLQQKLNKRLLFITNHPSDSRKQIQAKFSKLGFKGVEFDQIYTSAYSACEYLTSQNFDKANKKVYLIGAQGLVEEFESAGFKCVGGPDDDEKMVSDQEIKHDTDVMAVVAGTDTHFNYYKLAYAQLCLDNNEGCHFVSTNEDAFGHIIASQEWPGAGAVIGAIKGSTLQEPMLVGKPSDWLIEMIQEQVKQAGFQPGDVLMTGDRLDTDIEFGIKAGFRTALVLTGVSKMEMLESPENEIDPEFVLNSVEDLLQKN